MASVGLVRSIEVRAGPRFEPEDRICCTSEAHVRYCCEQTGYNFGLDFFKENGYVLWLRLEVMAEEGYICPHWEPRDSDVGGSHCLRMMQAGYFVILRSTV